MAWNGKTHGVKHARDLLPEERSANALYAEIHGTPSKISASRRSERATTILRASRVDEADRIRNALVIISILLEDNEAYLPIFLRLEADLKNAEIHRAALKRAKAYARRLR